MGGKALEVKTPGIFKDLTLKKKANRGVTVKMGKMECSGRNNSNTIVERKN